MDDRTQGLYFGPTYPLRIGGKLYLVRQPPQKQNHRWQLSSYVTMVFMQYGGLLAVRNRRVSIIHSNPLWGPRQNLAVPLGMIATALIAVTNLYGRGLQVIVYWIRVQSYVHCSYRKSSLQPRFRACSGEFLLRLRWGFLLWMSFGS